MQNQKTLLNLSKRHDNSTGKRACRATDKGKDSASRKTQEKQKSIWLSKKIKIEVESRQ
jgi:hypothetical protein